MRNQLQKNDQKKVVLFSFAGLLNTSAFVRDVTCRFETLVVLPSTKSFLWNMFLEKDEECTLIDAIQWWYTLFAFPTTMVQSEI